MPRWLERLAAARAGPVGLDLILSEPDRDDPAGDEALAQALRRHRGGVLPVLMELSPTGEPRRLAPAPVLAQAGAAQGHVHVELDADGIARSVFLREGVGDRLQAHMAVALADLAGTRAMPVLPGVRREQTTGRATEGFWLRDHWAHIAFLGPPGHFRHYSYIDVLLGQVPDDALHGKIILVGATAAGLFDAYPTPVSGEGRAMPGVEIIANVLAGLQADRFVRLAPAAVVAAFSALLVLALMSAFLILSPRAAVAASALAALAVLAGAIAGLVFAGWWLAPSAAAAGLLACFPVWSWRRLEATQRHMEEELQRFAREPEILASASATRTSDRMGDLVEQRIGQVRRATESLRDARRFVLDTLNGIPEGALVADTDLRVVLANPQAAALLGAPLETLAGQSLGEVLGPLASGAAPLDTWLAAAPLSFEARLPAGTDLLLSVVPFASASGARRGLLVSLVDVSAVKAAERAREETLLFVSHDLRSPLASILALLDLEEMAPDQAPRDMHPRIRRYVDRCLSLSDDFVQMGRLESLSASQFAPYDLVDALRAAIEDAEVLAGKKRIAIALEEAPDAAGASGVRDLILRVFANLLSNAVKYSPEGTRVRCTVRRDGAAWVATVADQGQGIDPAVLPRLFGRYERLGEDRRQGPGGAGLGLVFVKNAVEKHGGSIHAESELGRGTRFVLRLPALNAAPPPA